MYIAYLCGTISSLANEPDPLYIDFCLHLDTRGFSQSQTHQHLAFPSAISRCLVFTRLHRLEVFCGQCLMGNCRAHKLNEIVTEQWHLKDLLRTAWIPKPNSQKSHCNNKRSRVRVTQRSCWFKLERCCLRRMNCFFFFLDSQIIEWPSSLVICRF